MGDLVYTKTVTTVCSTWKLLRYVSHAWWC